MSKTSGGARQNNAKQSEERGEAIGGLKARTGRKASQGKGSRQRKARSQGKGPM